MMSGEDSERRVKNTESALKTAEQSIAVERKELHAHYTEKKKALDAALAERERALTPIAEDLRVLYERIAKRHHGVALAESRDGQCAGAACACCPTSSSSFCRMRTTNSFAARVAA